MIKGRQNTRCENGFTLVELLVALVVTSIVLAAVATLAFAMGTANDISDDTSRKQAEIRFVTLRISELIGHCRLICATADTDLAVWRADDNDDGLININELIYIDAGPDRNYIRFYECDSVSNPAIMLSDIDSVGTVWWLGFYDSETYVDWVPECSNVQFTFDVSPPNSGFVSVSFDILENGVARRYQTNTTLCGWAGHLLDGSGGIVSSDDD